MEVWRSVADRRAPCPSCGASVELVWRQSTQSIVTDDIPGGMWVENGFDRPIKVYSHSEHRARLAAEGCEIRAKWAGPHDKIMTNWAATISAHQLESAKILLSRGKVKVAEAEAFVPDRIVKAVVKGPYPEGVEHG
jgi:hypothetical protein